MEWWKKDSRAEVEKWTDLYEARGVVGFMDSAKMPPEMARVEGEVHSAITRVMYSAAEGKEIELGHVEQELARIHDQLDTHTECALVL